MSEHTTGKQRELFYQRHQGGETYTEIAIQMGVSRECKSSRRNLQIDVSYGSSRPGSCPGADECHRTGGAIGRAHYINFGY